MSEFPKCYRCDKSSGIMERRVDNYAFVQGVGHILLVATLCESCADAVCKAISKCVDTRSNKP